MMVVEAMKMENPVTAHKDGTVTGLTAAPAIAVDLAAEMAAYLGAEPNESFCGTRAGTPRYAHMTDEERAAKIAEDPAWGRMVCRCEQVTEAEIAAAVNSPIPAITLDAITWRRPSPARRACRLTRCARAISARAWQLTAVA